MALAREWGEPYAVALALGCIVALIGGLTTLQYLTDWNLHIDELLKVQLNDRAGAFVRHRGRMSLNAALTLTFAGLALALMQVRVRFHRTHLSVSPGLALLGALPVLAAFVGYAIGLGHFTGILNSTNILLHTAVAQLALCGGILAVRPQRQPMRLLISDDASGVLLRWVGPASLAILLAIGWFAHRGELALLYDAHDALALTIFLGLTVLALLLFIAAVSMRFSEERRMRADAAVREQEERFRTLADNISQLAWMTDASGSIFWYNKRWFEYTGTTLEEMKGWGWQKVHHPDHVGRVTEHFKHSIATGHSWEDIFPIRSAHGEWRWFLSRALPRKDENGQIVGWFGTNTDITEQRAAAEALAQAKEAAEQANKAKDEFLAALSHELRTPLSPVLMTAEEMCNDPTLPAAVRDQLCLIKRNVQLESRLIDDLLDLTRIARGTLGLQTAPCDLQRTLRDAVAIVRDDAAARSHSIIENLQPQPAWIIGDSTRLQQVFWNVLRNAVKFTPRAGRITLTSRIDDAQKHWILEVSDTGVGIAPEVLPLLFSKFEQGERTNDHRFGGLGLGLAISKAIVDLHGGVIHARSDGPGRGATFIVELGPLIGPPAVPPDIQRNGFADEVPPLRLLVVEDHEPTAAVMMRLLRRAGHTVVGAGTVASALRAAQENNLDLVICDLGLPDGSGYELMQQLRERFQLRGIAVSGYGMEEDVRRSAEAGFAAHLTKPVEFAQLREALRHVTQTADVPA